MRYSPYDWPPWSSSRHSSYLPALGQITGRRECLNESTWNHTTHITYTLTKRVYEFNIIRTATYWSFSCWQVLQECIMRKLIGAGEREGEGLYQFRGIETATAFNDETSDEGVLWLRRLGYLSPRIVTLLPGVWLKSSSTALCLSSCDVCLWSKQTKKSFLKVVIKHIVILNSSIGIFGVLLEQRHLVDHITS